jgi:hypothetical protein
MRRWLASTVLVLITGVVEAANSLNSNDLVAPHNTVHKICEQPDQRGSYLKIDGDFSSGAAYESTAIVMVLA